MSRHDWQKLTTEHEDSPEKDSLDWLAALQDLDDPDEWERALEADPLLMFQRLPEEEPDTTEIESMKAAVASMRRTHDLESMSRPEVSAWQRSRVWALAALLVLSVSLATLGGIGLYSAPEAPLIASAEIGTARPDASLFDSVPTEVAQMPLLEDVDPEVGPFMQIEDDGLSLVVVMADMELLDGDV